MGTQKCLLCGLLMMGLRTIQCQWHPVFQNVTFDNPGGMKMQTAPTETTPNASNKVPQRLIHHGRMQLQGSEKIDAFGPLLEAMERGTDIAKSILNQVCSDINLNVAPFVYEDMSNTRTLMQVSAPFVLMHLGAHNIVHRMRYVFVPSALVRQLLRDPANKVVWTNQNGEVGHQPSAKEEAELLVSMWQKIPHDVYISINTQIDFALGDSDCALVSNSYGHYSVVSTMIHELLHGAGVYSLIEEDRSGGLQGHVSVFDALLKHSCAACDDQQAEAGCYLFDKQNIHHLTGRQLAGQSICMNESLVYNPSTFNVGSSLSHFTDQASVMGNSIAHSTCRFELSEKDLMALAHLGWKGCNQSHTPHVWFTEDALLPADLLSRLHVADTPTDTVDTTSTDEQHTHTKLYFCDDFWYHYRHSKCYNTGDEVAAFFFFFFLFALSICFVAFCLMDEKQRSKCLTCCADTPPRNKPPPPILQTSNLHAQQKWSNKVHEQDYQLARLMQPEADANVFVIE